MYLSSVNAGWSARGGWVCMFAVLGLVLSGCVSGTGGGGPEAHRNHAPQPSADPSVEPPSPEPPMSELERQLSAAQLDLAKRAVADLHTVRNALSAGFVDSRSTASGPAHLVMFDRVDEAFDPLAPEMLLAAGTSGDATILTVVYFVIGESPPDGFAGPDDHWHRHHDVCVRASEFVRLASKECAESGGRVAAGWMLHAWVVAGQQNPNGVFAIDQTIGSDAHAGMG